jgi:crotonobetainyl-CoA:carnitine CoA-transferase CaiB-like acyl-CoA transferase
MNQPLEGVKILDFGMAVATPLGTLLLADMGAEVIKIEKAQGECLRRGFPAG